MLTRRPRKGDVLFLDSTQRMFNKVEFSTDDGLVRDERGRAMFIWKFGDGSLNRDATIIEEGPNVPDPREQDNLLHNGQPYQPKEKENV